MFNNLKFRLKSIPKGSFNAPIPKKTNVKSYNPIDWNKYFPEVIMIDDVNLYFLSLRKFLYI